MSQITVLTDKELSGTLLAAVVRARQRNICAGQKNIAHFIKPPLDCSPYLFFYDFEIKDFKSRCIMFMNKDEGAKEQAYIQYAIPMHKLVTTSIRLP